jgi:hypothetical protein
MVPEASFAPRAREVSFSGSCGGSGKRHDSPERPLEAIPKKLHENIANERGYNSDHKIFRRKKIPDGPN